jgi:hypothetical protein
MDACRLFGFWNRVRFPVLLQHQGQTFRGNSAMIKIGGFPVKTRIPLMGWVVAGLITLASIVSSLSAQVTVAAKDSHYAGVSF